MVVINLYPFEETIAREGVTPVEAIEQIDIGGPAMIRSAAKNYNDVAVVTSPDMYRQIRTELILDDGALSLATRELLARLAFMRTAIYDAAIFPYLSANLEGAKGSKIFPPIPDLLAPMSTYMNLFSSAMKAMTGREFTAEPDEQLKIITNSRWTRSPTSATVRTLIKTRRYTKSERALRRSNLAGLQCRTTCRQGDVVQQLCRC